MLAVGFDIGGTHTKLGLVDEMGNLHNYIQFQTNLSVDSGSFLDELFQNIESLLKTAQSEIIGIGMSLHGYVDEFGPIVCPNTPALRGINMRKLVEDRFGLPVKLNNDLVAHSLAEYHFGSGQGTRRFMCLAIGTGLGAGVIIDGQALKYTGGCAGDTGHLILIPGGPECSMGCKGCAEALCSVAGIERLARERLDREFPAHIIISGARRGDMDSISIIEQIGAWLGILLASLSVIYMPQRIALTGGIAEAGQVLLESAREAFFDLVGEYHNQTVEMTDAFHQGVQIVLGRLRGETGVVGAVVELFQAVEKNQEE